MKIKISKNLLSILFVLVLFGVVVLLKVFVFQGAGKGEAPGNKRLKGPSNAAVKVTEYTDFQCPACSKANTVVENLLKKYDGKFSLEHKHYPLKMHANALKASIFAQCADGQGRFWPMHDVLFKSQTSWEKMEDPSEYFTELAVGIGMDRVVLEACLAKDDALEHVFADMEEGSKIGVQATPTFVINGKFYIGSKNLQTELERRLGN